MAKQMNSQAEALLQAHIAHTIDRLSGKALHSLIESEIDHAFAMGEKITLNQAVTRDMIKDTVRVYAVELELSGAIPELVGDIARSLYANPVFETSTLNELLPDEMFSEFLDKALEMRELREWLVHEAVANPVYSALASDIVMEGVRDYAQQSAARAKKIPGAAQAARLGQSLLGAALPAIEDTLEDNLRKYIRKSLQNILNRSEEFLLSHFDEDKIRELALDVWDLVKDRPITDFTQSVSGLDVEEFFVIGYEAWRELRLTPFYSAMINGGIDSFFEKYGDSSLRELLDEMGITREIAIRDAMRFAPPVLAMMKKKNLLEPIVRRNLEGFYQSAAVVKILSKQIAE
jgi:hypothetical protein